MKSIKLQLEMLAQVSAELADKLGIGNHNDVIDVNARIGLLSVVLVDGAPLIAHESRALAHIREALVPSKCCIPLSRAAFAQHPKLQVWVTKHVSNPLQRFHDDKLPLLNL